MPKKKFNPDEILPKYDFSKAHKNLARFDFAEFLANVPDSLKSLRDNYGDEKASEWFHEKAMTCLHIDYQHTQSDKFIVDRKTMLRIIRNLQRAWIVAQTLSHIQQELANKKKKSKSDLCLMEAALRTLVRTKWIDEDFLKIWCSSKKAKKLLADLQKMFGPAEFW